MSCPQRTTGRRVRCRSGQTLIELVIAMGVAGTLLVGMASATLITLRASDTSGSPLMSVLDAEAALNMMTADLQYALTISESQPTAISVTVPDRDNNGSPETIRYSWSGIVGQHLTRAYNGGAAKNIARGVHEFRIGYQPTLADLRYLDVRLRLSPDTRTRLDTAIAMVNEP